MTIPDGVERDAEATQDSTLPLDDGDIHVCQDGPRDAPALLLIHGSASSARSWDPLVPLLTGSHRVIRIDLLGHGRSAKPAGPGYGIPDQGRRVAEALDRLGVERAVVRHSTGGSVSTAGYRAVLGARVELLPGVGHSPMLEDPARTAAPLLAFAAIHATVPTGRPVVGG
ncbi:alpha/beta fold hydrolase [Microtetraspora niveoalba]|uniref:alpha/beta fold hydrolase n=1 Tax=Microtetraspora niveoalba TaxID=46175 RepID=UPI00082CFC4B|nr:alpha/beta fold hydrolase [Microtetraspora niveoalba]